MADFMYFLEGLKGADHAAVSKAGLAGVLPSPGLGFTGVDAGPDGASGVLVSHSGRRLGYNPGAQTWRTIDGRTFGWWNDSPPTPEDLCRVQQVPGHFARLDDGGDWLIPCARVFPSGTRLPRTLRMDDSGELTLDVKPEYRAFAAQAETLWDVVAGTFKVDSGSPAAPEMNYLQLFDVAAAALAINYRIGRAEIGALELLSTDTLPGVWHAVVDWPAIVAALQKKTPSPSSESQPGGRD